jgi:hypothetical protein
LRSVRNDVLRRRQRWSRSGGLLEGASPPPPPPPLFLLPLITYSIPHPQLWVWAPAGAKAGDKLPVQVCTSSSPASPSCSLTYPPRLIDTHGGGLQNSQSPNNDFSDWVGQSKGFIAVNANYRLGLFVFLALSFSRQRANSSPLPPSQTRELQQQGIVVGG